MRRSAAGWALIALLGASADRAYAQETLSWSSAIVETRKNHPDLVSAREAVRRSEAIRTQAASGLYPQVSGTISGDRSRSGSLRTDSYRYEVSGTQLLFDGFQTHFGAQSADRDVEAAREDFQAVSSQVRQRLREAYTDLLKAQELLSITQKIAGRRKQSQEIVRLRYDAGREHKGSLLTAEANSAQADFEVDQARRGLAVAQRRLSKELGRSHSSSILAEGSLDAEETAESGMDFESLAEKTPAVRALVAHADAARWDVRSAWAGFFPTVTADASMGQHSSDWPPHGEVWSAGVSFSLPLFEGGNLIAGVARANATLAQAKADEKSGRDAKALELESSWNDWKDAVGLLNVQTKFLEAARERNRIAESEYSTGLIGFNDWIIIEDNLVRTEKTYLDAKAQAVNARAAWDQARGVPLDENEP